MRVAQVTILSLLCCLVFTDTYMQNPRGSNNRLNEKTANRKNNNRLFDSQNNNKGGYNTGDRLDKSAGTKPEREYSMQYYASGPSSNEASKLQVEWTNQHGCGTDETKLHCNIVIQYMCQSNGTSANYPTTSRKEANIESKWLYLRDGIDTDTQKYSEGKKGESDKSYESRMKKNYEQNSDNKDGLHETVWWYDWCRHREANGGLFLADQKLKTDKVGYVTASRTRQNNDGDKSGYECPEERDYFPYWQPTTQTDKLDRFQRTPWIDLAWLGDPKKCSYIKKESFNRHKKGRCVLSRARPYGRAISEKACQAEDGKWVEFESFIEVLTDVTNSNDCKAKQSKDKRNKIFWGKLRSDDEKDVCIVQAPEPICKDAPWTRVNHLGNFGDTETPHASVLEVDLPHFPSGDAKRCVLRLRYNITTADYDPWNTFAPSSGGSNDKAANDGGNDAGNAGGGGRGGSRGGKKGRGKRSTGGDPAKIKNNPEVDVLGNGEELQLAFNTAQTGRTFQDRSHVFIVLPRIASMAGKKLHNLNVRGKRGNIVQTFPATEYDFVPDKLTISRNDLVHIQWTGSNSHDNNNDGDAGQGKGGTDRHNMLEMVAPGENFPVAIKEAKFWKSVQSLTDPEATGEDIAVGLATSGFYCGKKATKVCPDKFSLAKKRKLDDELDNAPASYFGHVLKFSGSGTLFYMCSRNNNFSNRSQKGAIIVK